ncbi:Hypothetical protein; putative exported protein [Herminiimonas arsenicoxydans]|uniref:Uncharacterized protein n=1 Tax=Herminiimonas arsenicoxydans TaxID=204773 RepID=A4G7B1_HERAR|nr:Hypothetical protein; putative exported protein [Herminiimonas arsenicoxydans]
MSLTSKLTAALVLVLLLVGSHWYVYNAGNRNGTNAVLVGTLTATNKALTDRIASNSAERKVLDDKAKKASQDHAKEIEDVKRTAIANAGKRVPIDPGFCRPTGQAESTASGSNGQDLAGAAFLPEFFTIELRQAAAFADEITADMRTLVRRADEAGCFQ